jgi:hypothetical protein
MKKSLLFFRLIFSVFILFASSAAFSESTFPSHCKPEEFVFVNAKMAFMDREANGYFLNKKNGKILSLCSDKQNEPFGKLIYRYGSLGKIEMERTASEKNKFFIYTRADTPHTGKDEIFFNIPPYIYYVSIAVGQDYGVYLAVYKSKNKVLKLFSGSTRDEDFQQGSAYESMNFDSASSTIFTVKDPAIWP